MKCGNRRARGGLIEDTHAETEKGLVFIQYICHVLAEEKIKF